MTIKWLVGIVIAFAVGFGCRWFDVPAPAPPMWQGALLVVAMTLGYSAAGAVKKGADAPAAVSPERRPD